MNIILCRNWWYYSSTRLTLRRVAALWSSWTLLSCCPESSLSYEKQPHDVHSITAWLSALAVAWLGQGWVAVKDKLMDTSWAPRTSTHYYPQQKPSEGGSQEPVPGTASVGDAKTDGHPQQDISSRDLKTSWSPCCHTQTVVRRLMWE